MAISWLRTSRISRILFLPSGWYWMMASLDPIFSTMPLAKTFSSAMLTNWNLTEELPLFNTRTFIAFLCLLVRWTDGRRRRDPAGD